VHSVFAIRRESNMSIRTWFAKLRYPTPDLGDFVDEVPLDVMTGKDGDDNKAEKKK
jgi:hypothetical protein